MKISYKYLLYYMIMLCMSGIWIGCNQKKEPIRIGFAGCLTGRISDLGISGRDGVILAIEEINQKGGIQRRQIELIIKNDQHDPETAIQVVRELIQAKVIAIIGPMTSSISMVMVPVINKEKMVMISPTASTNRLTGIKDYFFRITPPNKGETEHLAEYALKSMSLKRMVYIYDLSNQVFGQEWGENFKTAFEARGGEIIFGKAFTSGQNISYLELARELLSFYPEGLAIAASAMDTAMLCQQIRKLGSDMPVISSGWAKTPELIHNGGVTVEGTIFSQTYNNENQSPDYLRFQSAYQKRFGKMPDFGAVYSYEAVRLLLNALSRTEDTARLKDALPDTSFKGLQGNIRIDAYGDAERERFLLVVQNRRFREVGLSPLRDAHENPTEF